MIGFGEARAIIAREGAASRLPVERLATSRAHGRVLAEDVIAPIDLPPFDNSAMDGFALRWQDLDPAAGRALRLAGEQFAGVSLGLSVGEGECIRITTGAPMPAGADAVVMREDACETEGVVTFPANAAAPGQWIRRAGEDVRAATRVLRAGTLLSPARVALASALGIDRLEVAQRPTVAVFTGGDEIVEAGMPLRPGEIHDANRELLMGLLRAEGLEPVAWPRLPDEPGRIAAMLDDAGANFDLVVTCGAVSAGERDHLPALVRQSGELHFWKVAMKPGMPVLFARIGRAQLLALPGNPVSALATWLTLGRELVDAMQGRVEARLRWHARLTAPVEKRHARREFLRGTLQPGHDAVLRVEPDPASGSHRLAAASHANALIVLAEGPRDYAAADLVEVIPL